jgi:ATP-binding cassette subfamily B protein
VRALDRILVFDRGHVAEEGSHAELMLRAGPYRDLFTHQAAGLMEV